MSKTALKKHKQAQKAAATASNPVPASLPQALLGSGMSSRLPKHAKSLTAFGLVQDENVKNLMMSWYYAGYYTGLYEGQQKAYAAMEESG